MDKLPVAKLTALALEKFIGREFQSTSNVRRFFRLDGFEEAVYKEFLNRFRINHNTIASKSLEIRTTSEIGGFEDFMLEPEKSATWYRNHVAPGRALILIFNKSTSDGQSLKDIFPVTENLLATEGLDYLIEVAFYDYQLSKEQQVTLKDFIARLRRSIPHPQLYDLVAFLASINTLLKTLPGMPISEAIAENLPLLGLFRCRELSQVINTAKGDHLLRDIYHSASLRSQLIEERELQTWLVNLREASFEDDRPQGGASPEEKRVLLEKFLTDVLADRSAWMGALQIDWSEVSSVLYKKARKTKPEKLKELQDQINDAIQNQLGDDYEPPTAVQDVLRQLREGNDPDPDGLDELLDVMGDSLPSRLRNQIKKLRGTKKYTGSDFVIGVIELAVQMCSVLEETTSPVTLDISFDPAQISKVGPKEAEALIAFRTLYGGIEDRMPPIQWHLADLWALIEGKESLADVSDGDEEEQEKSSLVELLFQVRLQAGDENLDTADLCWQYRSDGLVAMTLAHIRSEQEIIKDFFIPGSLLESLPVKLRIPIYNTSPESDEIGDLDLSQPFRSLGIWYQQASRDLRGLLEEELKPWMQDNSWQKIHMALEELEIAYASFVHETTSAGLLKSNYGNFLDKYGQLLTTSNSVLQKGKEILYGFRAIPQAWVIGPSTFENWAVIPIFHPAKLLWWTQRLERFNQIIERLLESKNSSVIIDDKRFRQELAIAFNSSNYPAILSLPDRSKTMRAFLPIQEYQGYEIFGKEDIAGLSYGLASELIPESDSEQAAKISAREIACVIEDYIETYPFASNGLEIYIIQCKNSAFPGYLVEQLAKSSKKESFKVDVVVHVTPDQGGAPLFRRITEWLTSHEEFNERPDEGYFPQVSLKVLESSFEELIKQPDDTDLVILLDVLAERGQELKNVVSPALAYKPSSFPLYQTRQNPFEQGEFTRSVELTPMPQAHLLQSFYNVLWASLERKAIPAGQNASFYLRVSLQDWEDELISLHKRFNWVICYDTTVDRFLLEDTLPGTVEVIRYSLGLGIKRRHNLTVSSSQRTHDIVVNRLTKNLEALLPGATYHEFRHKVSTRLVEEAKNISGDIVLRAAGPGAYLNEMIGLVAAKYLTEQQYRKQYPNALTTWIYLDDFAQWFDHKHMPDLLFVAIPSESNQPPVIHIELLETKCVGENGFTHEANEAQHQVVQGVNRLFPAWQPGCQHLDAPYWYDQLYQAVVGNLILEPNKLQLWEVFKANVPEGNFVLEMSGHAWVFCHDGSANGVYDRKDGLMGVAAQNAQTVKLTSHHFGRTGLRKVFQQLVNEWKYEQPPDIWSPQYDRPIVEPVIDAKDIKIEKVEETQSVNPREEGLTNIPQEQALLESTQSTELTPPQPVSVSQEWLQKKSQDLTRTFRDYSIETYPVNTSNVDVGPSIVRFKVRLRPGENLSRLQRIATDLQRELALDTIPIIDNIRGTHFVGVDLPHPTPVPVQLLPLLSNLPPGLQSHLTFIVGQTPDGQIIKDDLAQLPHLLVAGSTGSGKTVFLYTFLVSLLHQLGPEELSLLLIDPKQTDFIFFEGLPHLLGGQVVIEPEEAITKLTYLMNDELNNRTLQLREARSRDIHDYNSRFANQPMKFIVVVIDEYADLIQVLDKKQLDEFERQMTRLAQRARNVGVHLVVATQRPSADIVTSRLKTNLTARIAFRLPSHHDSLTILDQTGAENLIGKGDMLFKTTNEVIRVQAPYISSDELTRFIDRIVKGVE